MTTTRCAARAPTPGRYRCYDASPASSPTTNASPARNDPHVGRSRLDPGRGTRPRRSVIALPFARRSATTGATDERLDTLLRTPEEDQSATPQRHRADQGQAARSGQAASLAASSTPRRHPPRSAARHPRGSTRLGELPHARLLLRRRRVRRARPGTRLQRRAPRHSRRADRRYRRPLPLHLRLRR